MTKPHNAVIATASLPRVKQKCAEGQVCTFETNGFNICIAPPPACQAGAPVTSVCMCGKSAYNCARCDP